MPAIASDLPPALFFLLVHGAAFAVLASTAGAAGLGLLGRWRGAGGGPGGGRLEALALALPLGLAGLAQAGLVLGLLGILGRGAVVMTMAAAWVLGGSVVSKRRGGAASPSPRTGGSGRVAPAAPAWALAVALAVAVAPIAALSLYPPTAFDATLYHLPYARDFAAAGAVPFLPALRYPIFPQLQELLFTQVMLLADDVAAQGVTLLATLGTALLLLVWARRRGPEGRAVGWIAAAGFLGCPIVAALAGTAYVEPGMVLFGTAAWFAFQRWRGSPAGETGWLVLAGIFAGSAAAVKYLGLVFVAAVVVAAALAGPAAGRWRRPLATAAAAAAMMAPWYLRILAATGNPLFPYFPDLFGGSPWVAREFPGVAGLAQGWWRTLWELVRLPWDLVVARQRLGGQPPYSPLLLALLPALAVTAIRDRRTRAPLLLAAAYAAVVLALLPEARYLLPLAVLLSVAMGEGIVVWLGAAAGRRGRRAPASPLRQANPAAAPAASPPPPPPAEGSRRRLAAAAAAIAAVCLLPGWLYAGYRAVRLGPVPVTAAARDRFLARELPVYAAIRYLNQARGSAYTVYALHAENMAYFAAGRFLGDWSGPAAFRVVVPPDGDPAKLDRHLLALGASHLLIVRGKASPLAVDQPAFRQLFEAVYADEHAMVFARR